jgi:hypothetical protein
VNHVARKSLLLVVLTALALVAAQFEPGNLNSVMGFFQG